MTRSSFKLLSPGTQNKMGISEIRFAAFHKSRDEIISRGTPQFRPSVWMHECQTLTRLFHLLPDGPKHYYMSMNRLDGSKLACWPASLDAVVQGSVPGRVSTIHSCHTAAAAGLFVIESLYVCSSSKEEPAWLFNLAASTKMATSVRVTSTLEMSAAPALDRYVSTNQCCAIYMKNSQIGRASCRERV